LYQHLCDPKVGWRACNKNQCFYHLYSVIDLHLLFKIRHWPGGDSQVCTNICVILRLGGELVIKISVFIISILSLIHCQFSTCTMIYVYIYMRTLIDLVVSFVMLNHTCNIGLTIIEHSSIMYINEPTKSISQFQNVIVYFVYQSCAYT
jgi:hypothetical protein